MIDQLDHIAGDRRGPCRVSRLVNLAAGVGDHFGRLRFSRVAPELFSSAIGGAKHFERLEMEELSKTRGSASLFESSGADTASGETFPRAIREIFCSGFYRGAVFSPSGGGLFSLKMAATMPAMTQNQAALGQTLALLGLLMLALFLLGKYSAGLSGCKTEITRTGRRLFIAQRLCVRGGGGQHCGDGLMGFPRVDFIVARVLCVVAGLIALETLLGRILEIYRVRVKGRKTAYFMKAVLSAC